MALVTLNPEHAMRVLINRLNWPVRLVRWQAAKEFAGLLSSPKRALATRVFLDWMQSRQFETEVVAGMAVLMCTTPADLPSPEEVKQSAKMRSILADLLFQRIYGKPLGGWLGKHSGPAPDGYQAEKYFEEHKGQAIPLILSSDFQRLQDEQDLPFQEQWAFEWHKVMDATNSPYSSYPYHFMNASGREGVGGQFSQSQCNVYRSAFLRTLAFAVQRWDMPRNVAVIIATRCLPLSQGLHSLRPIVRPTWLEDVPEKCCKPDSPLEELSRRLLKVNIGSSGMRPVSLRIPISNAVADFGEISIESFYVTEDFKPKSDFVEDRTRMLVWPIADLVSFAGKLPEKTVDQYRIDGTVGSCTPVCLNVWPSDFGFWQNDYLHLGFAFPAPYNFSRALWVESGKGYVDFSSDGKRVGYWKVWHDNWSPIHAKDGHTRCGGLTELKTTVLCSTAATLGMKLAWHVKLSLWQRPSEFGAPVLTTRSVFFRD
jgi:hypothetical protein